MVAAGGASGGWVGGAGGTRRGDSGGVRAWWQARPGGVYDGGAGARWRAGSGGCRCGRGQALSACMRVWLSAGICAWPRHVHATWI
jgi:hypothetical protein